jgi:hypothetical protein
MTRRIPTGAPTKREALRELLRDGHWHHMSELRKVGGWRYGARLLELRRQTPGLTIEHRSTGADNEFEYRALFPVPQPQLELLHEAPKKPRGAKARIAELVAENTTLKRRLEALGVSP